MMMRELLLYAVAWDSPRTKNSCCCVCNALLSEHVSIRRNAFLLITEHAAPFLSELARGQHFRRTKDKFHDAHASHARILAIAMLSSLERVPSLIKWSEDKKIGTFMGGLHLDQTDNVKEEENEEIHHDKILEVYLRPGDLVERLAVEDDVKTQRNFVLVPILQFRDSSPGTLHRFLVSFYVKFRHITIRNCFVSLRFRFDLYVDTKANEELRNKCKKKLRSFSISAISLSKHPTYCSSGT